MSNVAIFIPTLRKGGAEKQAILLANALGEDNKILFILLYPELGIENELLEFVVVSDFELIKLEGPFFKKLYAFYQLLKNKKVDSLFCYLTKPDLLGAIIGRLSGVKHIYQGIRSAFLPKSKIIVEKIASFFSSGIIINCYSGKEEFTRKGLKKIIIIPNCYINPKQYLIREQKKKIGIISVGRFVPDKDYYTALASVAKLRDNFSDFIYTIVGYGELESDIRKWIKEFGLLDNVKIIINPTNIIELLQEADIYLSTSSFEGTSNSIMEALDTSLPVVATKVGDNYMLVEEEENGYLSNVGDSDALAASLLKLVQNYEMRLLKGKKSNELLKSRYSFDIFRSKYLNLIR